MNFQERLKQAIKAKGYTALKAAKKSGLSISTLRNWIYGKSEPTLFGLMCISKALDVSIDWLVWGNEQWNKQN